jgi:hypothetical protein
MSVGRATKNFNKKKIYTYHCHICAYKKCSGGSKMAPPKQQKSSLDFCRRGMEEKIRGLNGGTCAGCDGRKVNFKPEYFILMRIEHISTMGEKLGTLVTLAGYAAAIRARGAIFTAKFN